MLAAPVACTMPWPHEGCMFGRVLSGWIMVVDVGVMGVFGGRGQTGNKGSRRKCHDLSLCRFFKIAMMQAPEREGEGEGTAKKQFLGFLFGEASEDGGRMSLVPRDPKGRTPRSEGPRDESAEKKRARPLVRIGTSILQVHCTHWSKASGSATLPHQRFSAQLSVLFKPR